MSNIKAKICPLMTRKGQGNTVFCDKRCEWHSSIMNGCIIRYLQFTGGANIENR